MTKLSTIKNENQLVSTDQNYQLLLKEIKEKLLTSQFKAAVSVNTEMIQFYWEVGNLIVTKQSESKWGDKLFEVLSYDLSNMFPDTQGFSKTNLKNMRAFYLHYPNAEFGQALPDQITWTHHVVINQLINKDDIGQKNWYASRAIENGWSYRQLQEQIKSDLYSRQSAIDKTTNFKNTLPALSSELAHEMVKDPYKFHFLTVGEEALEKDIQQGLVNHIRQFLMELGQGFAFYGSSYPIYVSGKKFEIDLIFYHTKLHAYVVCELKRGELKPRDTGQLNFYLTAVDEQLKMPEDGPTIGLLLCEKKDKIIAEYSLKRVDGPIGIAEYEVLKELPDKLRNSLPSIDQIEAELSELNLDNGDNL